LRRYRVVPQCRGNKYRFDKTDDSLATLSSPKAKCFEQVLAKYALAEVEFTIRYARAAGAISVMATAVPLVGSVTLDFDRATCGAGGAGGGDGGEGGAQKATTEQLGGADARQGGAG
jgi:hypothetical protein